VFKDPRDPLNPETGVSREGIELRHQLDAFVLAFDSNLAPIVGQQVTLTRFNADSARPRIRLLISRAMANECDLIVRGTLRDRDAGFVWRDGSFIPDSSSARPLSEAALQALVGRATPSLTYTCVPPGSGPRLGVDRDSDGYADGDELERQCDPTDPTSTPY
jgi:hypothetical protein